MSRRTRGWLLWLVAIGLLAVGIYLYSESRSGAPGIAEVEPVSTLEQWIERTRRPGFVLLDEVELEEYFICVYDTGSHEVALCYSWKRSEDEPDTSLSVQDADNRDLQDSSRWSSHTQLNEEGMVAEHAYVKGMVIPVQADYRGPIRIVFRDDHGSPDGVPTRVVYAETLPFGS